MARLMLSAGMFSALAAATAVRRRGFPSGSPPALAAMVISLIRRVKALPRFASSAPFLCLIVAHFEWPDMGTLCGSLDAARTARDPVSIAPGWALQRRRQSAGRAVAGMNCCDSASPLTEGGQESWHSALPLPEG